MSQMMDHIEYLSKEIGPRPAGTEEEQQAALYIAEQFQKETDFAADIEEFETRNNLEIAQAALSLVAFLGTVLAIIFNVLTIPVFALVTLAAAIYALEAFDRPLVSRFLPRGASQNVIAKYQPNAGDPSSRRGHSRKLVLVAHYDTGRVAPPLVERVASAGIPIGLACVIGMIAAAFLLLIRIFIAPGGGMGLLVLNVLSILAAIVCLVPAIEAALVRGSSYNEGANNNASGTAALIEVARRISRGSVSESDLAREQGDDIRIHGEAAAREAGLIPEGAQLLYEAEQAAPSVPARGGRDEEERLLSAKAAIAALTGQHVEQRVYSAPAGDPGDLSVEGADAAGAWNGQPMEAQAGGAVGENGTEGAVASGLQGDPALPDAYGAYQGESIDGFENAPNWFVAAQQNARKPSGDSAATQVQRSKYTEAFDRAARERAEREEEMRAAEEAARKAEEAARAIQAAREAERAAREAERRAAEEEALRIQAAQMQERAMAQQSEAGAVQAPDVPDGEAVAGKAPAADAGARGLQGAQPEPSSTEAGDGASATTNPSRSGILRKLRTSVPSLSGVIRPSAAGERRSDRSSASLSAASVPSPAGDSGSGAPARSSARSPLENSTIAMSPVDYDMEVPLDGVGSDSVSRELGKGPGEVTVPRSRSGNLLERIRRDKEDGLEGTPQEWLDVDEDFEARSVGRARGSWESFRDDNGGRSGEGAMAGNAPATGSGEHKAAADRRWQGGAYSRAQLGRVDMRSGAEYDEGVPAEEGDRDFDFTPEPAAEDIVAEEIEQIYHFRNPQFNMEIWFVAIGADGAGHDGAKAFVAEHRDELRGAMVIEVESLAAGSLSVATEEGRIRKVSASSRVKRFTRAATAATGIMADEVSLAGSDSVASTIQKEGFQTMHLFGAENARPALKGSPDDVLENLDEGLLDENASFVLELLKQ